MTTKSRVGKTPLKVYDSLGSIVCDLAQLFQPPDRLTVSQAAGKYVKLNTPGAYTGPYLNSQSWYMVEPQDTLTSPDFDAEIFVGPAQSGKTQGLLLNWLAYSVKVDPMDMIIFNPTNANARDFSMRRVDRLHRFSKDIGGMLVKRADADNKFDKHYSNGMMLTISWPTVTEMSGKPVGRIGITDYDRIDDDIGGDGSAFDLASQRTTTFQSFAMTLAESSPSRPILDLKYMVQGAHEAPPTTGILALYNRGDRRRRYWPCPECGEYFEPKFEMLNWETLPNIMDASDTVYLQCPHCPYHIHPDQRSDMDMWGTWLKEGQTIDRFGRKHGTGMRSRIASFWLMGPIATWISWRKLVQKFLEATAEFERTGSEEALKKFYNNDLALPYIPKGTDNQRVPELLKARAEKVPVTEPIEDEKVKRLYQPKLEAFYPMVPPDVRFLLALVDVQKNMFIVHVFGILPGRPFDMIMVDRFSIVKSNRIDSDGDYEWCKPHAYLDDWNVLRERVMAKTYPLSDDSGRHMQIKAVGCDSGGKEGVTTNAYNFWRLLREDGEHSRFHLLKGDPTPGAPRARVHYPDSNKKDRFAPARGDVPVLFLASNENKSALNNRLDCITPGAGMVRFPHWMPDNVYTEMCSEVWVEGKGWQDPRGSRRNEAWDLSYYCIGLCVSEIIRVEYIDWARPPGWAQVWDDNDLVFEPESGPRFALADGGGYDFKKLAAAIA